MTDIDAIRARLAAAPSGADVYAISISDLRYLLAEVDRLTKERDEADEHRHELAVAHDAQRARRGEAEREVDRLRAAMGDDEFKPYLAAQLKDPEFRAHYAIAQQRDDEERDALLDEVDRLRRYETAVEKVRAVHKRRGDVARHDRQWCGECNVAWPCPTVAAIDAALEGTPR